MGMLPRRWVAIGATAVVAGALLSGCGGSDDAADRDEPDVTTTVERTVSTSTTMAEDPDEGRGDIIPDDPEPAAGPSTDLVSVVDPVNSAFTVEVPADWDNLVYSTVDGQMHNEVVNSVSPDGGTVVFIGDPKIPSYWNPATANDITRSFAEQLDSMELAPYSPAPEYFEAYVRRKFEGLDGFQLVGVERNTTTEQSIVQQFIDAGMQPPQVDAADVRFSFVDAEGVPTEALVIGTTVDSGDFWRADVVGAASDGAVDDYLPMLSMMTKSKQTNPEFIALQDQRHQATMAMIQQRTDEMTRQHQANMAWIQDSANAHQQRMQSIWQAGDASVAGFYDRMRSGDVEQRQFLNYINEESTVQNSSGTKFQVDNSYQRYWMNTTDNTYVGGDVNFGESQLRELGLDPSAYEEVPTVKG